jgi:hypothetical protein
LQLFFIDIIILILNLISNLFITFMHKQNLEIVG